MVKTTSYAVNEYSVSKLHDGSLQRWHSADDAANTWLEEMATKALAK